MPNLKDIKSRIQSVQNTQKITKAMKMVAAAKVKRAESSVKASRPFSQQLLEMFRRMLATTGELDSNGKTFDKPLDNYPKLLSKRDTIKTEGLVVVTSNKGLAGAYNANIVRTVLKKIEENSQNNVETLLYIVGQKGISALQHKQHVNIEKKYIAVADKPSSAAANMIAEDITEDYVSGKIDKIEIITTRFNNMMSYSVQDWTVLPIKIEKEENNVVEAKALMEFIPDTNSILQKLVPMFITNSIFQALLEASASELASRMTAMSAASKNAEEMINNLTVSYNKARQSAITQELIEIVSGASAQK